MFRTKRYTEFERSRVFRPRLLIRGSVGMGQQYLAAALLNHFEGLHVQSFDLSVLLSDSSRVSIPDLCRLEIIDADFPAVCRGCCSPALYGGQATSAECHLYS